ncbi:MULTISPECIES: alpha-L-fucosidase [Treponema]|uniref:alpha-L-fucosidase n=1 Tax=Treponema rectale TaxID=744512 RepID=A0A840SFZ2_9SPIR|nr:MULTISPECIES: alpha-L-fucosidase [Treponema]MBB5219804.1 alpha-L-fucosidase [Treponema rectale]MBE6354871.1 alpha-L-fucosidase [Treponema sp.]
MFNATFESLRTHSCPDWFQDAKFGIWSHWGPQSVPMFGDWYARNMYIQDSEQYLYHLRHYGHPSKFGYKDICALWKAENFDPDALMEQYYKSGARYFVAQASHHDHFFNFASDYNRFNSVEIGPHKDICGMWKAAAKKYNLPFGMTEHLGASFAWWRTNKGSDTHGPYAGVPYDGNDPAYRDFYHDNYQHVAKPGESDKWVWLTENEKFHEYWLKVMKEIIDKYEPDLLYSDSWLPFGENFESVENKDFRYGLEAVAYLYNKSEKIYGKNMAVYTQKSRKQEIYEVGVLDIERSQLPDISPVPWQSETCIGDWFYNARAKYKKPRHVIDILIDTIAKNGTMLLNILQKPDGTVDEETMYLLKELEKWFAVNSEAVYGTRPWRVSGEGSSQVIIEGFTEEQVPWREDDFRFVQKNGKLYAFMMGMKLGKTVVIKSIRDDERVTSVRLLSVGELAFMQHAGLLIVELPKEMPTPYANALEISFEI